MLPIAKTRSEGLKCVCFRIRNLPIIAKHKQLNRRGNFCRRSGADFIIHTAGVSCVKVSIITNNDLHYDLLLLSSTGCIAISTGSAHNKFPFPCSNGYWNAAPIVYAVGAFYLVIPSTSPQMSHPTFSPKLLLYIYST